MASGKSGKQRAAELRARRKSNATKRAERQRRDVEAFRIGLSPPTDSAPVNADLLAPDSSYDKPEFVSRGYYLDVDFTCRDCGKEETWTATQQKWWYETAKGGVWTVASRCRPCRRKVREQAAAHKRRSAEGRIRKQAKRDGSQE